MVWKSAKELGCAYAVSDPADVDRLNFAYSLNHRKEFIFSCCNYGPRDNLMGQFKKNVLPPLSDTSKLYHSRNSKQSISYDEGDTSSLNTFQKAILKAHNDHRVRHESTLPLKWSKAAERIAQKWCDQLATEGKMYHSDFETFREKMGENLYMQDWESGHSDIAEGSVAGWYEEEDFWDYRSGTSSNTGVYLNSYNEDPPVGHFTQVVWRETTEVGCGHTSKSETYVCCNYNPPGNELGAFKENVGNPL